MALQSKKSPLLSSNMEKGVEPPFLTKNYQPVSERAPAFLWHAQMSILGCGQTTPVIR